jgi:hypothetical protein
MRPRWKLTHFINIAALIAAWKGCMPSGMDAFGSRPASV